MDISKLEKLQRAGRLEEAEKALEKISIENPKELYPLQVLGIIQKMLGKFDSSLVTHEQCINLDPNNSSSWNNKGCLLYNVSRDQDAIACFKKALELEPNYTDALASIASCYLRIDDIKQAEKNIQKAIQIDKNHFIARQNQVAIELQKNNYEDALELANNLLRIKPDSAELYVILGKIYEKRSDVNAAKKAFEKAISLKSDLVDGMIGLANWYLKEKGAKEAIQYYENCLAEYPKLELPEIRWNLSLLQLKFGDYKKGWELYEYRWKRHGKKEVKKILSSPEWDGLQSITGKKILIYQEQGFGDQILFIRYACALKEYAKNIYVQCNSNLANIFNNIRGIEIVDSCNINHDFNIPICSLPLAYGRMTGNFMPLQNLPFFDLSRIPSSNFLETENKKKLNIGFAFSGNKDYPQNKQRSIPIETFSNLFDINANWHCLQVGVDESEKKYLNQYENVLLWDLNFYDTARFIRELDFTVCIDTSLAHLSAAVMKKTYLLLHDESHFTWRSNIDRTDWYQSIEIIRQSYSNDWISVINKLKQKINQLI